MKPNPVGKSRLNVEGYIELISQKDISFHLFPENNIYPLFVRVKINSGWSDGWIL